MQIKVVESVLKANDAVADENRRRLNEAGVRCFNLTSAPGSGKTTLLEKTIPALGNPEESAVLVGDLQTTRDAERLGDVGCQVTQINTGRGCHLSATQVKDGLDTIDLKGLKYLWIENVGNMVCPSGFDLGEHDRVVLLSLPEGDDKVAKYPTLFQPADVVLVTKTDLRGVLKFDMDLVLDDLSRINPNAPLFELSPGSADGLDAWIEWVKQRREM